MGQSERKRTPDRRIVAVLERGEWQRLVYSGEFRLHLRNARARPDYGDLVGRLDADDAGKRAEIQERCITGGVHPPVPVLIRSDNEKMFRRTDRLGDPGGRFGPKGDGYQATPLQRLACSTQLF